MASLKCITTVSCLQVLPLEDADNETNDNVLSCRCAGAYKAEEQGLPAQRRSLAANALASWSDSGGASQAGASGAAASAPEQVMPFASSPTLTLQISQQLYELTAHMSETSFILSLLLCRCRIVVLCERYVLGSSARLSVGALGLSAPALVDAVALIVGCFNVLASCVLEVSCCCYIARF